MNIDMHYCCLYTLARCTGLPDAVAVRVASASQFVDDFTTARWLDMDGIHTVIYATALDTGTPNKSLLECIFTELPFHMLPGGQGETPMERLATRQGGTGIQKLLELAFACRNTRYLPELMGITCHAIMDSYAHWGFSAFTCQENTVQPHTIQVSGPDGKKNWLHSSGREHFAFARKDAPAPCGWSHSDVDSLPDIPHLRWSCEINGALSPRDNPTAYLNACRVVHDTLCRFKQLWKADVPSQSFFSLEAGVRAILETWEMDTAKRCLLWKNFHQELFPGEAFPVYQEQHTALMNNSPAFERFIRAAMYHRDAVLGMLVRDMGFSLSPHR